MSRMRSSNQAIGARAPQPVVVAESFTDLPHAAIEIALERILASRTFRRSDRHRRFLVHIVRTGLSGRHDRLKELIIGLEVFGKRLPDYDPRRDPIVRVEASRLRDKLARFYGGEGDAEVVRIDVPVGSYVPLFSRHAVAPVPERTLTLAVLPFANLGGDATDTAFTNGLADQLIDTLGQMPGLQVVARLSAVRVRASSIGLEGLGRLLEVDHVIEGSLQCNGTKMRCIAHLSRTRDSERIWSQRFDHDRAFDADLFDFQDRIAEAMFSAVCQLREASTLDRPSWSDWP